MGMVAYFARVNEDQLGQLRRDPQLVWASEFTSQAGVEVIDIDKAWDAICYLLCDSTREMARWNRAAMMDDELPAAEPDTKVNAIATSIMGASENRVAEIDCGYGGAANFAPGEVAAFAQELSAVTLDRLRQHLDFQEMDRLMVNPDGWLDDGEGIFSEYVVPLFNRVREFYRRAAGQRQRVLVWYA
jgi:hypothetical protein